MSAIESGSRAAGAAGIIGLNCVLRLCFPGEGWVQFWVLAADADGPLQGMADSNEEAGAGGQRGNQAVDVNSSQEPGQKKELISFSFFSFC